MDLGKPLSWAAPLEGDHLESVTIDVKGTTLKIWYDLSDAGVVIRSIEGDDITATHLKALHLGELREELQRRFREDPDWFLGVALFGKIVEEGIEDGTASASEEEPEYFRAARRSARHGVEQLPAPGPKPGRGADHEFYREIAIAYNETIQDVGPRGVIKTMAEKWGVPRDKVAVWVRRSRETGWLMKRTDRDANDRHLSRGRAYGGDGPRLEEWRSKEKEQ